MEYPLVSVIIPSYNSKQFVTQAIQSARSQSYPSIEIILIDDGSTDGTSELMSEFERLNVKYIKQNNAGASPARNTGIALAQGEFVQFLDADDVLHPGKIE